MNLWLSGWGQSLVIVVGVLVAKWVGEVVGYGLGKLAWAVQTAPTPQPNGIQLGLLDKNMACGRKAHLVMLNGSASTQTEPIQETKITSIDTASTSIQK